MRTNRNAKRGLRRLPEAPLPLGRACSVSWGGSGLSGLETADLAAIHGESPGRPHLAPGVVAVCRDQAEAVVRLGFNVHVPAGAEDLTLGPVGDVTVTAVVRHGGARSEGCGECL